jgi:hypothetical protein
LGQGITEKKKGETNPTNTENNLGEVWTTAASTCVFINPKPSTTANGYHNIPTDINQLQAVGEDQMSEIKLPCWVTVTASCNGRLADEAE